MFSTGKKRETNLLSIKNQRRRLSLKGGEKSEVYFHVKEAEGVPELKKHPEKVSLAKERRSNLRHKTNRRKKVR